MKIELYKSIQLIKMDFIGEVDFFNEKSPYIKLLENIETKDELIESLEEKDLPNSAIKNIIKHLENLKVLDGSTLSNVENGFTEKEYGKYSLELMQNDFIKPFKHKNIDIKREKAISQNIVDDLKENKNFINMINSRSKSFKDNKTFKIINIQKNKALIKSSGKTDLKLIYEENKWTYKVIDNIFDMEEIELSELFRGEWDYESQSLKISFSLLKDEKNAKEIFEYSYKDDLEIDDFGKYRVDFYNIPIIPKTLEDAKEWFLYLLKNEIENKNRYISKDELKTIWNNLIDKKTKFKKFDLKFDFQMILNEFGKESKYYWLLQAGVDLYPFDNALSPKDRIIIESKKNVDLYNDLFLKFNIDKPKTLCIVDRWIVNLEQYQALEEIIKVFDTSEVTIITQEVQNKKNLKEIEDIIKRNNIKRIIKSKKEIVHPRYWIIDKNIYLTTESLDFIKINNNEINTEYTSFELYDIKDLDPKLLTMEIE